MKLIMTIDSNDGDNSLFMDSEEKLANLAYNLLGESSINMWHIVVSIES